MKIQACGWFSPDELPEPLHPGMVAMLDAEPLRTLPGLLPTGNSYAIFKIYLPVGAYAERVFLAFWIQAIRLPFSRGVPH